MITQYGIINSNVITKEVPMLEKILSYILMCCKEEAFDQTSVSLISDHLKISRSQV